jgi:hypothetical protein
MAVVAAIADRAELQCVLAKLSQIAADATAPLV